jgi:transmembrane sensor
VIDLDERLGRGPLKVQSLGVARSVDELSRHILKRRRQRFARNLTFALAAVGLLAFVGLGRDAKHAPEKSVVARAPAPVAVPLPERTTFADGSFAQLADPQGALEVEEESPRRVVTRLRGRAKFNVVAHGKRAFEVHTGEVRVRVLGSAFSMEELPGGKARVQVEHGPVEVAWLGGTARLESGQSGAFPPDDRHVESANAEPSRESAEELSALEQQPSLKTRVARHGYRKHAKATPSAPPVEAPAEDAQSLMAQADAERLHGQPEQAVKPLRAIFERYPSDARAPLAAFALGRVLLDDLHRPAEAAAAFARVRVLAPEGALAPDALAREASAWEAAGQLARAQKLAEQYLALHPRGRHAAAMQKTLAR